MSGSLLFLGFLIIMLSFVSIFLLGSLSFITFPLIFTFGLITMAVGEILYYVKDQQKIASVKKSEVLQNEEV